MRILDRYILKSVLSIFFGCLLTFIFLYVIIDIFSHLEDLLKQKIHFDIILQYYFSSFPFIFVQVTPIACLLATIYTFAKLNRDNEIIAMRSAGLSIFDVTKTVFIFGIIISVMVFLVNDRLVPQSQVLNQKIKTFMESGRKRSEQKEEEIINNLSMYGMKNRLFFVNKFSPTSETMEGITILEHNEHQDITKKIVANKGRYIDGIWLFSKSITYEFDANGQIIKEPRYLEEEIMDIPESPYDFLSQRQSPDFMNISQLKSYLGKLSKSGATAAIRNFKVELYQRYASPFAAIIIILLGIPFSLMIRKRATGISSLGVSIILGFLYYVVNAVGFALGKAGILMPSVAVSLGHITAILFSAYLIKSLP